MSKDPHLYVCHALESIGYIEEFLHGCTQETLKRERMRYDAVLRNLQTMAESLQRLPKDIQDRHPSVPWRDISGFRNIIVHDYLDGIDEDIIWVIVTIELPAIKTTLLDIRQKLESTPRE